MGLFSTDADLLGLEPCVFLDVPFGSQRHLRVTDAAVNGVTVTSATGGFDTLVAGDVVVLRTSESDAVALGVTGVTDGTTLALSGEPIGLGAATGLTLDAITYGPQAALVHDELLRSIDIDPDDPDGVASGLDESMIVSLGLMGELEAMGVLARVYGAAAGIEGDHAGVTAKARYWLGRYRSAWRGARVLLDVDGDGAADAWRCAGVGQLVRG
jgi:hypothetical protein